MERKYRNQGAIGALLDEYERALEALFIVISPIEPQELAVIIDLETKDEDCRSIQTILTHILKAGYFYAQEIRKNQGETIPQTPQPSLETAKDYILAMKTMFAYSEQVFKDFPNLNIESQDLKEMVKFRMGQVFDYEQLMEHAIVHILRHRRQIERFRIKYKKMTD